MPIQVIQSKFSDNFGTGLENAYKSNAGDKFSAVIDIQENIKINSQTNPLFLDLSMLPYQITSSSLSWLDEGFRLGDQVQIQIWQGTSGVPINSFSVTVQYVDDSILGVSSLAAWYDAGLSQYVTITVTSRSRSDLEALFNHSLNSSAGSEFSLIDGEVTRALFNDLQLLAVSGSQSGVLTGNKSGQFLISASITRNADSYTWERSYRLTFIFVNSGVYDSQWFFTNNCLKTFVKLFWASLPDEIGSRTQIVISPSANTGYFNEAHNIDLINSVLTTGVTEINYSYPSSHNIVVTGPVPDIGIGSCYIPIDETYYKNRIWSQNELTMMLPTSDVTAFAGVSFVNEFGAGYTITIDNVTTVLQVTTIDFTFTPNAAFTTFMDGREVGDRLFKLWVKCGDINWLAFNDQLEEVVPVGAPLVIEGETAYFDHSQNVTEELTPTDALEFNTEDDMAYFGYFMLEKTKIYEGFSVRIEAFNSTTGADFTLRQQTWNFTAIPFSGDGRYLLNETALINGNLPLTSVKREAALYLIPVFDTATHYAVGVYFPWISRWEYWLSQTNASVDFFPNQNKNWQQYDGALGWSVQLELSLVENGISHDYTKQMIIKPYDSEPNVDQTIELYLDSTNQNVGIVVEGQLMRVVATHELNVGFWNQSETWGMITVEPTESQPRRILSTVVPFDNDLSNPLTPLAGLLMQITYPAPNIARMECYFNPDLINLENGCKFTTKIKGCLDSDAVVLYKTTTDGIQKTTTNGDDKTLAQ